MGVLYLSATNGNFNKPAAFSNIGLARCMWDTTTSEIAVATDSLECVDSCNSGERGQIVLKE